MLGIFVCVLVALSVMLLNGKFERKNLPRRHHNLEVVLISLDTCTHVQLCLYVARWSHHRMPKLKMQKSLGFYTFHQ